MSTVRHRLGRALSAAFAWGAVAAVGGGVASAATPNDPLFGAQAPSPNQYYLTQVHAPGAWDITKGKPSVVVGVVDDGVDLTAPDLAANLEPGYDFGNHDPDPSRDPGDIALKHGDRTASLVAAVTNNGAGMAGAGWNVRVAELKVRDNNETGGRFERQPPAAIADAFQYAGQHGIRVVNASLGLRGSATNEEKAAVRKAILDAPNTLFVVSAGQADPGEAGRNVDTFSPGVRYPCTIKDAGGEQPRNLICVGGTDESGALWSRSNFGPKTVGLLAPAPNVFSLSPKNGQDFTSDSGTSYSAPLVAATAALYLSCYPTATTAQIRAAIFDGVHAVPASAQGKTIANGELDMAKTLAISPTGSAGCTPGSVQPPTGGGPGGGGGGGGSNGGGSNGGGSNGGGSNSGGSNGGGAHHAAKKTVKASLHLPRRGRLRRTLRHGIRIRIRAKAPTRATVRVRLRKSVARRHHLHRTVATRTRRCKAGTTVLRVPFTRKVKRRLRGLHTLRVRLTVTLHSRKASVRVRPAKRSATLKLLRPRR